jgi:hypothetical protein
LQFQFYVCDVTKAKLRNHSDKGPKFSIFSTVILFPVSVCVSSSSGRLLSLYACYQVTILQKWGQRKTITRRRSQGRVRSLMQSRSDGDRSQSAEAGRMKLQASVSAQQPLDTFSLSPRFHRAIRLVHGRATPRTCMLPSNNN